MFNVLRKATKNGGLCSLLTVAVLLLNVIVVTAAPQTFRNFSSACSQATTITLGQTVYYGITTGFSRPNITCNYPDPTGTAWFRIIGTGAYVQADSCRFASPSIEISVLTGTCNKLSCLSFDVYPQCDNYSGFAKWFAKQDQVYYIYVAGREFPSAPSKFALTVTDKFTKSPTPAPTPAPCNICGPKGFATNGQVMVSVPGVGKVACSDTHNKAIRPSTCASLQSNATIQKACGCKVFIKGGSGCSTATTLKLGQTILGSTIGGTFGQVCQSHITFPSVSYRFVGTGGLVTISTCTYADSPTYVTAMNGTCDIPICFPHEQKRCGANPLGIEPFGASISFYSILNQVYHVPVWNHPESPGEGHFELTLSKRVQPLPTSPPTPAPKCYVCGSKWKRVTRPNSIVHVPSLGNVTCSRLQDLATKNSLVACSALTSNVALQKTCGCQTFEVPHTCQSAPTIRMGQTVYGSTVGALNGPGTVSCVLTEQTPGSWYRFIGNGKQVTLGFSSVYAFRGSCTSLSCLNYGPTTWFAEVGQVYYLFATSPPYFTLTITSAAPPAPTPRSVQAVSPPERMP